MSEKQNYIKMKSELTAKSVLDTDEIFSLFENTEHLYDSQAGFGFAEEVNWTIEYPEIKVLHMGITADTVFGRPQSEFRDNYTLFEDMTYEQDKDKFHLVLEALYKKNSASLIKRIILPDGMLRLVREKYLLISRNDSKLLIKGRTEIYEPENIPVSVNLSLNKFDNSPINNREYEQKLISEKDKLLNSLPDFFLILDSYGNILDYYSSESSNQSVNPADLINKHISIFLPDNICDSYIEGISKSIDEDKQVVFDYYYESRNGSEYYEARLSKLSEERVIALIRDVKKQKLNEIRLEYLNSLNHLINSISSDLLQVNLKDFDKIIKLSLAQIGVFTKVDRVYIFKHNSIENVCDNIYEWCSEGINSEIDRLQKIPLSIAPDWMNKFNRNECVYIPSVEDLYDLMHPEKEILLSQGIKSLLAAPMYYDGVLIGFIGFDSVQKQKEWDEEQIYLLKTAGELFAASMKRCELEMNLRSQIKDTEESNKAKSLFITKISNELKSPLNSILVISELLLSQDFEQKQKKNISSIYKYSQNLLAFVSDILDYSKIDAGILNVKKEFISIRNFFDDLKSLFFDELELNKSDIHISINGDFPDLIYFDEFRLRQILYNIILHFSNVLCTKDINIIVDIPYCNGKNLVDVRIRINTIKDSGNIDIDNILNMNDYDADIQGNNSAYLGLVISKKLIEFLGGEVKYNRSDRGEMNFDIVLNKVKVRQNSLFGNELQIPAESRKFGSASLMIIDSKDFNRDVIKTNLSNGKLKFYEAVNRIEAEELITKVKFDVILTNESVFNQANIQNRILNLSIFSDTTVIAYSDETNPIKKNSKNIKYNDYISNPFNKNELTECLIKYLPCEEQANDCFYEQDYDKEINMLVAGNLVESIDRKLLIGFIDIFEERFKQRLNNMISSKNSEGLGILLEEFNEHADNHGIEAFSDISARVLLASNECDSGTLIHCLNSIIKSIEYCNDILYKQSVSR